MNGAVLWGLAMYSPGQSRKKKAMHAMSAVARAPGVDDITAMSMAVRRIFRGIGRTQLGAGSVAWKPWRSRASRKSVAPRAVSLGSGVPSRASVWPTERRAFSTVRDWTSWLRGAMLPLQ